MLDNLKTNLRAAIKKIVNSSGIDEELIKELSKDVQRALLQSDVNVKLVLEIIKNGLKHFENSNLDIVLIDTAGRHKEEKDLLDEMTQINKVAEPDLALLVIDGTIGQQCYSQAEAFHKIVPVGGIVITKLDSSAKGGGAIAA